MQVRGASFGPGRGRAAEFRLADERYKGKPPSMEFTYWNGTPFGPEAANVPSEKPGRKTGFPSKNPDTPVRKTRTETRVSPIFPVRKTRTHLEKILAIFLEGRATDTESGREREQSRRGAHVMPPAPAVPPKLRPASVRYRRLLKIVLRTARPSAGTQPVGQCQTTDFTDSTDAGHDLICAQCGAGLATDPPSDAPTIRVTNGKAKEVWVHAGRCRQFWIEEHPQFQFKQEQDRA